MTPQRRSVIGDARSRAKDEIDSEGHIMPPSAPLAGMLAHARAADIERELLDRYRVSRSQSAKTQPERTAIAEEKLPKLHPTPALGD